MTTSTNMHLGYEWMRPALTNDNRSNVLSAENTHYLSSTTSTLDEHAGRLHSLSSTASSNHLQHAPFNIKGSQQPGPGTDPRYQYANDNMMLGMYQSGEARAKLQEHGHMAVGDLQQQQQQPPRPSFTAALGEQEEKLLAAGPVRSEIGARTGAVPKDMAGQPHYRQSHHDAMYAAPTGDGHSHLIGRDHMHDAQMSKTSMVKEQEFDSRQPGSWPPRPAEGGGVHDDADQDDVPAWGSINKDAIGTFDSNGVFRPDGGQAPGAETRQASAAGTENQRQQEHLRYGHMADLNFAGSGLGLSHSAGSSGGGNGTGGGMTSSMLTGGGGGSSSSSSMTSRPPLPAPAQRKWLYRDPQGNIQGPFDTEEMQDWFAAGFFAPTLMIRRDDEAQFEPLIDLVRKTGDDKEPFRAAHRLPPALHMAGATLPPFIGGGPAAEVDAGRGAYLAPRQQSDTHGCPPMGGGFGAGGGAYPAASSLLQQQPVQQQQQQQITRGPEPAIALGRGPAERSFGWRGSSNHGEPSFAGMDAPSSSPYHTPPYAMNPPHPSTGFLDYQRAMNEYQQQQQYIRMLQQQKDEQLRYQQQHYQQPPMGLRASLQPMPTAQQQQYPFAVAPEEKSESAASKEQSAADPDLAPIDLSHQQGRKAAQDQKTISEDTRAPADDITQPMSAMKLEDAGGNRDGSGESEEPAKKTDAPAAATQPSQPPESNKPSAFPEALAEEDLGEKPAIQKDQEQQQQQQQVAREDRMHKDKDDDLSEDTKHQASRKDRSMGKTQAKPDDAQAREASAKPVVAEPKADEPKASIGEVAASPAWDLPAAPKKTLREIQQEEVEASKAKAKAKAKQQKQQQQQQQQQQPAAAPPNAGIASVVKGATDAAPTTPTATSQKDTTTSASQRPISKTTPASAPPSAASKAAAPAAPAGRKQQMAPRAPAKQPPPAAATKSSAPADAAASKPPSEEFMRWCRQNLRGLNRGVSGNEILQMLLSFPLDASSAEIIQDIIYANSTSMDGRRFANEFIKCRKADLAGKFNVTVPVLSNAALDDGFKLVTKKGKKK